mmetsp:Transcript_80283/g.225667  ORF Transcript_80283/g.225667 Transcript_80283/m.225667 type:complete len:320 (-) Transcript_80283:64-1023(-)
MPRGCPRRRVGGAQEAKWRERKHCDIQQRRSALEGHFVCRRGRQQDPGVMDEDPRPSTLGRHQARGHARVHRRSAHREGRECRGDLPAPLRSVRSDISWIRRQVERGSQANIFVAEVRHVSEAGHLSRYVPRGGRAVSAAEASKDFDHRRACVRDLNIDARTYRGRGGLLAEQREPLLHREGRLLWRCDAGGRQACRRRERRGSRRRLPQRQRRQLRHQRRQQRRCRQQRRAGSGRDRSGRLGLLVGRRRVRRRLRGRRLQFGARGRPAQRFFGALWAAPRAGGPRDQGQGGAGAGGLHHAQAAASLPAEGGEGDGRGP